MTDLPRDQGERDRFAAEWNRNFAVAANAGSGKTTAISKRLAEIARSPRGPSILERTAVVTYTNKAAAQIRVRARDELLKEMGRSLDGGPDPLAGLDKAFFGTIHSFCIHLAATHGSELGVHLNPTIVDDDDSELRWQEFLEGDPMTFSGLGDVQTAAFLRHSPLDAVFEIASDMDPGIAETLLARRPEGVPPQPPADVLGEIRAAAPKSKGKGADNLERNKAAAEAWARAFAEGRGRLPMPRPEGNAAGIKDLYRRLLAPLKAWLAAAGGVLAAELALRYRDWRGDRGIQTYADQIETAVEILGDAELLEKVRAEGWRVILDEAQDTDPKQFSVLVEVARPPGAVIGTWPGGGGKGPRPGHFCMVGDAQQGIYSDRADIENFQRHVRAFEKGDGGEKLTFEVTFRAPGRVVSVLNRSLPAAFGLDRAFNFAVPLGDAPPLFRQVPYVPLVAGPSNPEGAVWALPVPGGAGELKVNPRLAREARHVAAFLARGGPSSVGAGAWGDVCILAPRNKWLPIVRAELEAAGLGTSLLVRNRRNGDIPVYAWMSGLMAVVCDPWNTFEWAGVLREVFAVSDAAIAAALRDRGRIEWGSPEDHAGPVAAAVLVLRPFILRADAPGESLMAFAQDLARACGLAVRARLVDPDGGLEGELARLLAGAADLGQGGAGPRDWLAELLARIDDERASGTVSPDAINLISCHSAKGLEWPVVIPVGLWRPLLFPEPTGIMLVNEGGERRVVFDGEGVGDDAAELKANGRLREQVRLLYVALTRAKASLVIPVSPDPPGKNSFAELWGLDLGLLDPIPEAPAGVAPGSPTAEPAEPAPEAGAPADPAPPLPSRILPHALAEHADAARAAMHEASQDLPSPVKDTFDPLDYGLWWHETLEFVPWTGGSEALAAHARTRLGRAAFHGFRERAEVEWGLLLSCEPWRLMREARWTRLAEAGIFAPRSEDAWIDGVIDLVLHDPAAGEVWIVDWKTNRRQPGEDEGALLDRLLITYRSQLAAYGACAAPFFPGCRVRLWVFSTVAGAWAEVT
jgi:ATP-dependent exoDNAse (exonuclease V) beta subunit